MTILYKKLKRINFNNLGKTSIIVCKQTKNILSIFVIFIYHTFWCRGSRQEGTRRSRKRLEGTAKNGKEQEETGRIWKDRNGYGSNGKGLERTGKNVNEREGTGRNGKEQTGTKRNGKERKGTERNGIYTWTKRSWNWLDLQGEAGRGDTVIFSIILLFT